MPTQTERNMAANALHQAYLVNLIAEAEAQCYDIGSDSEYSEADLSSSDGSTSSSSTSSSESSSEDEQIPPTSEALLAYMGELYSQRYLADRDKIMKDQTQLHILLNNYKFKRPEIFRSYLRIDPGCFDDLLTVIQDDPVFHNNSNHAQMPVSEQLAIALYRFGHYGNASSTMKVALWAGVGFGTVPLVTNRVLAALCSERFRKSALQWSSNTAKATAKAWVADTSCPQWRDGWLMVDGTLVPLHVRPGFFGNTFYDRKSNYPMNVQIISTPDLRIIDYGVGLPGSQHDATAWQETRVPQEYKRLLGKDEWVWADSAYPLRSWCQAPYKKPEKDTEENTEYNYYVSKVRIRSEHCMGFLKGRWSSLRGLRMRVDDEKGLKYATLWITACIHLHAFAMNHEDAQFTTHDQFYRDGLKIMRQERQAAREMEENGMDVDDVDDEDDEVKQGKLKREHLKTVLFAHLNQD